VSVNHKQLIKKKCILHKYKWYKTKYPDLTPHNSSMLENWCVDMYSNVRKKYWIKSKAEQRHGAAPPVQWRDWHRNSVRFYQQLSKTSLRKKEKLNSQQSGGWQHATNEKQMCVRPWPIVWRPARDQCVIGERLEDPGCVAADGRVEGVNSVAVNSLNYERTELGERSQPLGDK